MPRYELELPIGEISAPNFTALLKLIELEAEAWKFANLYAAEKVYSPHRFGDFDDPMRKFAGFWSDVWHEINNLDDKSAKEKFEHIKQLIDIGDYVPPASSSPIGAAIIPPSGMPDSRWGFPSGPISDSMW